MPRPPLASRRRGSAAVSFLIAILLCAAGLGAYLYWEKTERERREAEAQNKPAETPSAQPKEEPAVSPRKDLADLPDITGGEPQKENTPPKIIIEPFVTEQTTSKRRADRNSTGHADTPAGPEWKTVANEDMAEWTSLQDLWAGQKHKFSPTVLNAYIKYAKLKARAELKASGRELPADFLSWVDSDPELSLSVYGARADAAKVLVVLRSLELDLGRELVRNKYTQLALATAIVCMDEAESVDLKPRQPMKLVIPGDPRVKVNTKDPKRTLDMEDHIINFLEDHAPVTGDMVGGMARALPELVYNERGVAEPASKKKGFSPQVKRELIAADVMASRALQAEFNAYMKDKGFDVAIDCGERVVFPGLTDAVPKESQPGIMKAYEMFRKAYENKGRLAVRDKPATPAERCLYLIRNEKALPDTYGPKKNKIPKFPLTAPWPMLTLLAADDQPLREREDLLERLKKNGEFHTYGEYIGDIAQQYDFQSARRLSPYGFGYGSFQMMLKDGGVCGTMATMCVRTYNMAGIPASTAGQPGHCALIFATRDDKTRKFRFAGGQYVTGGDSLTHPHALWQFGDVDARKPMIWHQSVAYATNFGMRPFLESLAAYQFYKALPEEVRAGRAGNELLAGALTINPYNMALADDAFTSATSSDDALKLWNTFKSALTASSSKAGNQPGGKSEDEPGGLYLKTLRGRMTDHLATLPAPKDKALEAVLESLKKNRAEELAAEEAERKKHA